MKLHNKSKRESGGLCSVTMRRSSSRSWQPESRLDKQEVLNVFSLCLGLYTEAVKVAPSVCTSADRSIIEQLCRLLISCKHASF